MPQGYEQPRGICLAEKEPNGQKVTVLAFSF